MRNERLKRLRQWCPHCDFVLTSNFKNGKCPWCRKKVVILESRLNTRLKIDKEVREDLE